VTSARHTLALAGLLLIAAGPAAAQQIPDTTFDASVRRPAFTARHPKLLFDEAHHNFHTSGGRYRALADLARNDGLEVLPNHAPFSAATLDGHDLLVIANALGHDDMADSLASNPAFTAEECDAVREWVDGGGALLLIADHAPMGAAAHALAARFGVDMRDGYLVDPAIADTATGPSNLVFTREAGTLADHAITRGRDSTERVRRVMTFTGQSLLGPPGSWPLLRLTDGAQDLLIAFGEAGLEVFSDRRKPAAGRWQGLAFSYGRGRVVVLGEAAMLSAQLAVTPRRTFRMGMNAGGIDNRQLALNILHWLMRLM
jgi:hypothetical protein